MKNKNVFWLGIVSFFTDLSSDMIFPVLPIFLSSVLGVPKTMIGLIDGLGELTSSLLKGAAGVWSDKIHRRKRLVGLGYGLSTVVKPFFSLISTGPQALLLRAIERAGKGIRTAPRDALITESVKDTERGSAFGFHRALDTSGAVLGTLVAFLFLLKYTGNYHTLFLLSFIPGGIAVICLLLFVKETPSPAMPVPQPQPPRLPYSPQFKKFLFVSVLFQLGSASYSFFALKAHEIGVGLAFIPLVYLVYSLIYALLSKPMGKLSDRIGRHKVLPIGFLAFALTAAGFALLDSPPAGGGVGGGGSSHLIWLFIALYGISLAITDGVSRAFVADLTSRNPSSSSLSLRAEGQPPLTLRGGDDRDPPLKVRGGRGSYERHGAAFGVYHMATGLASLLGAVGFGLLWDRFGAQTAFLSSAALTLIATVIFVILVKQSSIKTL
ncbi:MAG: MFS transporter [bacterium]|nr:MFS transporter [bacterium]